MRRSRWVALGAVLALALGLASACQTPTSMTVIVSTDVDCSVIGGHLAHVVAGPSATIASELAPSTTKPCEAQGEVGTVVLLPADDESLEVGIKVVLGVDRDTSACGTITEDSKGATDEEKAWSGCIIARRRLAFIEGEALSVEVPLNVSCIGVPCSDAAFTTCVQGGRCVPGDVDPADCVESGCGEDDLPGTVSSSAAVGPTSSSSGEGGAPPAGSSEGGGPSSSGGEGGTGGAGGSGGGPECASALECEDPADPCRRPECVDGVCTDLPEVEGADCGDGRRCRADGECVECLNVNQCGALAECRTGLACSAAGECVDEVAGNGTLCPGGTCQGGACMPFPHCSDADFDVGVETDLNCGAECLPCEVGQNCLDDDDCETQLCTGLVCAECDDDLDCDLDQHCEPNGVCADDGGDGADCDPDGGGSDCLNGHCLPGGAGGICCDTECTGVCMGCGDGTCDPVGAGVTPPGCLQDACSNGCNADGSCDYEATDVLCDGPTCDQGTTTRIYCDGFGSCQRTVPEECSPNLCDGNACGDSCGDPSDCVPGAGCSMGECTLGCDINNPCPPMACQTVVCNGGACVYSPLPDGTDCGSECAPDGKSAERAVCGGGLCSTTIQDCCQYKCDPATDACLTSCDGDMDCDGGLCTNAPGGTCSGGFVEILPGECFILDPETP